MPERVLPIILFPLLGVVINLIVRPDRPLAGIVASMAAGLAFGAAAIVFVIQLCDPQVYTLHLFNWLQIGALTVPFAFRIDTLSVTMALVVTGVGTLISVYSIGYMKHDSGFTRYFVYLNLFLAVMLVLVTADNLLVMFIGWEGVGLCSFLLIGFWFEEAEKSLAARKAFLVNRVGDAGLVLAMLLLAVEFNTLSFDALFAAAEQQFGVGDTLPTLITLLMLLGITAKSAQIPLYIWLPDAMAGPTPASALIHAATMVTAGVYLMVRAHPLFALSPATQTTIVVVGTATALFAGLISLVQFDIKRVLAYSTISQLGFMVTAAGMGAYTAAIFHLVAHAFFKALLFLAAGSVITALEHHSLDPQDMRMMGGLRRRMPVTTGIYLVGALGLAGVPPLVGFFSKDDILNWAMHNYPAAYVVLAVAALVTALYMGRQLMLVFGGEARSPAAANAHENDKVMLAPMLVLAGLTLIGGGLNLPESYMLVSWLEHSLGPAPHLQFNLVVAGLSALLSISGLIGGVWLAARRPEFAWQLVQSGFYVDEIYERLVIIPFNRVGQWLASTDREVSQRLDRLVYRSFTVLAGLAGSMDVGLLRRGEDQITDNVYRLSGSLDQVDAHLIRDRSGPRLNLNILATVAFIILLVLVVVWREAL